MEEYIVDIIDAENGGVWQTWSVEATSPEAAHKGALARLDEMKEKGEAEGVLVPFVWMKP